MGLGILRRVFAKAPPIGDAEALHSFLAEGAAFISQKCTVEYCRARAGLMWDKLMLEKDFLDAMEVCRWEALAAVYADLAVLTEGVLRPWLDRPERAPDLADALLLLVRRGLTYFPVPPHRAEQGWEPAFNDLRSRLGEAQMAAPRHPKDIGHIAGPILFQHMPIHTSLRRLDREMITNSVRLQIVRLNEDMQRRLIPRAALDDLLSSVAAADRAV
ncbi:MAG: hypothetical protein AB7G39_01655 [Alphaproteobacteria bacterium]